MPELPEVETVKRILTPLLVNKTIKQVEILYPKMILSPIDEFSKNLEGKTFLEIKRKGKYLLFYLSGDFVLISHLRMEGKYIELYGEETKSSHARVIFTLSDGKRVSYDDTRCFGIMKLIKVDDLPHEEMINKLGQEPFDIKDISVLKEKLNTNTPIKISIMDQTIISGLGNIYADEVLFRCKLNPLTPSKDLNDKQIQNIVDNAVIVLNKAINLGGSTVKSYHAARGVDGKFQNELLVYGKKGSTCPTCNYHFKKITVGGRGTTYCPKCQKLSYNKKVVGIVGKIASGKTTALNYFKELGYETISSDEIVNNLYQDKEIIQKLKRRFASAVVDESVNKKILKEIILNDEKKKLYLESVIHPLVEEKLLSFIESAKGKLVFIEVPLLFTANMDYMCDYIIGIDVSEQKQVENLKKRNTEDVESYLKLNRNNSFDENINKMSHVTKPNISIEELKNELNEFLNKILMEC
ncbi:MAG: DNA-formamidopyrimidine glycosylase [Erysipelotrichales bacterium]|nr:DNA-formamidopyrimidine glycosylase [Erysipelotrichales bacterium]